MQRPNDFKNIHDSLNRQGSRYSIDDIKVGVDQLSNISNSLLVLNLPKDVYEIPELKNKFENIFKEIDSTCCFVYLPGFNRVRILMKSGQIALLCRQKANEELNKIFILPSEKKQEPMNCLFAKNSTELDLLELPKKEKQFLISPPASPPDDWQPKLEASPAVNYDLLTAIASLKPGETHELHASEDNKPAILLTPSIMIDDNDDDELVMQQPKFKIVQTRCPDRSTNNLK